MSEHERAFWSEYRARTSNGWARWIRLAGEAPVTYQEACSEILEEMEEDKNDKSILRTMYEYRIVNAKGLVVMEGPEIALTLMNPAEPARKIRDWEAEGYSEAEILRRWKIVDSMIEDLDEEKADREETLKQMKREVDSGNFYWIDVTGKLLAEQNDKIFELESYLKIGSEDE